MCRHLAYLGPPTTLSALVLDPPHSLLRQSYAPLDMRAGGTVNADGFGVGWYPTGVLAGNERHLRSNLADESAVRSSDEGGWTGGASGSRPVRYRSERPLWSDATFAALAGVTVSGGVLAAVRSATVGMPVHADAVAPFGEGRWLFGHNGVVRGWPGSVVALAAGLPTVDLLTLDAPTDAALVWALVRHRLRAGADPADAVGEVVTAIDAAAPGSRLNLLLTDGAAIWATTWTHALSVRTTADAVLVASEPYDCLPGWTEVPDRHLVVARPGSYRLDDLAPTPRTTDRAHR